MKIFLVSVLLVGSCLLVYTENTWQIPEKDREEIREVVNTVTSLGAPDAKGKELYSGNFELEVMLDPTKEKPPLPMKFCVKQSTRTDTPDEMIYYFQIRGLHLKDKEDNWLLNMFYPFKINQRIKLISKEMQKINIETLQTEANEKMKFDAKTVLHDWLEQIEPNQREPLISSLNIIVPVIQYLGIGVDDLPIALLCLQQMGFENAPLLAYAIADLRANKYWQLSYWFEEPGPFDPTNEYHDLQNLVDTWIDKQKPFKLESPALAFRRSLHRFFRHILINSLPVLSREQAEKLCLATLDPSDPQGLKFRIQLLSEALKIEPYPNENEPLKIRLSAWGIPSLEPDFLVYKGTSEHENKSVGLRMMFFQPKEAYVPAVEDLDQLFQLLDDKSPSRFIDYQGARTVGENALRAIAFIIKKNPLELVDMSDLKPWTEERRNIAAQKLKKWWKINKTKFINQIQKE